MSDKITLEMAMDIPVWMGVYCAEPDRKIDVEMSYSDLRAIWDWHRESVPTSKKPDQKHGKWIVGKIRGDIRTVCSNCEEETGTMYEFNYCPNCGARMDGADDA